MITTQSKKQKSSADRCMCKHPKEDHSDRPDQRPSAVVPKRPWCHACNGKCSFRVVK